MERAFERLDRELRALEQLMDEAREGPASGGRPESPPAEGGRRGTPELRRLAGELERLAHDLSAAVAALPQSQHTEDRRGSPDRPVPGEAGRS